MSSRILYMVKKNGLISENKTATKMLPIFYQVQLQKYLNVSTNYIEAVNLVVPKSKTGKNRKIGSDAAFTHSTEQPSSPYTTFFKPE